MELHDDCLPDGSYPVNQDLPSLCLKPRRVIFPRKLDCYHIWPCFNGNGNDDIPNEKYIFNKNEENITNDSSCNTGDTLECSKNHSKDMDFNASKHSCKPNIQVLSKSHKDLEKVPKFNKHVNSLTCLTCNKVFRSKDMMLRHEMCHAGSKPYLCDVCQAGLSSAVALKEHKAMHTQQKLYECKTCQKSFRQNSSYRRHLNIHLKTYPFECSTCKRRFSQRSYLRSHIMTHSGQKPHSCSQCRKTFAHLSDLNRHKIIHTGERPYKCDICGSSFADNSSRRRHQKEHENKTMKLMCKECDIHFEKAYEMKKHLSHIHLQIFTSCKGTKCSNKRSKRVKNKSKNDMLLKSNNLFFRETDLRVFPTTSVSNYLEGEDDVSEMLSKDALIKKNNSSEVLSGDIPIKKNNSFSEGNCTAIYTVQSGYVESVTRSGSVEACKECKNVNSLPVIGCLDVEGTFKVSAEKSGSTFAPSVQPASLQIFDCNYITHPDFNSEDYYGWLTEFVNFCKVLNPPIKRDMFNKISQVHKALSDVLASPSGILCSKLNFKVLLNLSQVLLEVTNQHLNFMFNQLQD